MIANGRYFIGGTGNFSVSRRDGTVIFRCYGGTGRYLLGVTAGRDGNFQREIFYRRDGTVSDDGQGIFGRDGTAGPF